MVINSIKIQNNGYVHCRSKFYSAHDGMSSDLSYTFFTGVNKLVGEIDSGVWAVSYLLSMYEHRPEDFVLFEQPRVIVDNEAISLKQLSKHSCYMDKSYPLFSSDDSVKKLVEQGLDHSKLNYSSNDIKDLFYLDSERYERTLKGVGNEIFRAMASIGFAYGKQVFCFPWLSQKRFTYYHYNMTGLLDILESLGKIVIVPVGY